jgi:DNA-binding NarL/FixJ family response regulator
LALACSGEEAEATNAAAEANSASRAVEVIVLGAAARAVSAAQQGDAREAVRLINLANKVGAWDPIVCACRASPELAAALGSDSSARRLLEPLYAASDDRALARRAGFRTRATRSPVEILSPREREVLGLLAEGMRNKDIAGALFISQSTTKVHVRNVLAKLGVRNRTEAVARYEMFRESA